MKKGLFALIILFIISFTFFGCGEVASASFEPKINMSGRFVDAPVEGLHYECSSGLSGVTDVDGTFTCKEDDMITFKIGSLSIGSCLVEDVVTPLHLHKGIENEQKAYNVAQLLHSLDNDFDPSNDIKLDSSMLAQLSFDSVDVESDSHTFQNEIASVLASASMTEYDRLLAIAKMFSYIDTHSDVDVSSVTNINIKDELEFLEILICSNSQKLLKGECVEKD